MTVMKDYLRPHRVNRLFKLSRYFIRHMMGDEHVCNELTWQETDLEGHVNDTLHKHGSAKRESTDYVKLQGVL